MAQLGDNAQMSCDAMTVARTSNGALPERRARYHLNDGERGVETCCQNYAGS